jgi:hypothetical protein
MTKGMRTLTSTSAILAAAMIASAVPSTAQAQDTLVLRPRPTATDSKARQREMRSRVAERPNGMRNFSYIGNRAGTGSEVSAACEDGPSLATQIMSGGNMEHQTYGGGFGSLDASRGVTKPAFGSQMAAKPGKGVSSSLEPEPQRHPTYSSLDITMLQMSRQAPTMQCGKR